jgi:hypothetical protein
MEGEVEVVVHLPPLLRRSLGARSAAGLPDALPRGNVLAVRLSHDRVKMQASTT